MVNNLNIVRSEIITAMPVRFRFFWDMNSTCSA